MKWQEGEPCPTNQGGTHEHSQFDAAPGQRAADRSRCGGAQGQGGGASPADVHGAAQPADAPSACKRTGHPGQGVRLPVRHDRRRPLLHGAPGAGSARSRCPSALRLLGASQRGQRAGGWIGPQGRRVRPPRVRGVRARMV